MAIIGCGNIALSGHLPALLKHPRFQLAGLCDVRPERMEAMLRVCREQSPVSEQQVRQATDYRDLLKEGGMDACILALHPEHSVDVAIDLLKKGVPVLDEKPLAVSLESGLRLAAVVEETRCVYQIGFCFRHCEFIRNASEWTRRIGFPALYQVGIYDEQPSQHIHDKQAMIQGILRRSSALTHEGSHVIDWMAALNPASITHASARALRTRPEYAGPNLWVTHFGLSDGSALQLTIGWLLPHQPACSLRMVGPNGLLDLELMRGSGVFAIGEQIMPLQTTPLCQDWQSQLDVFARAIEEGKATMSTVHDGLRVLRATVAGEQSFAENRVVAL